MLQLIFTIALNFGLWISEIVDKYRKKVGKLEDEINKILHEEWEERVLQRTENQANRAEKILKRDGKVPEMPRSWFQSHKQREEEKGTTVFYYLS